MKFLQTEQGQPGDFVQVQLAGGSPLTCFLHEFPARETNVSVPNMAAGAMIEIGLGPDESFLGRTAVLSAFVGAPLPQLGLCGCWVGSTGSVYVRLIAGQGGVSAGTQRVAVVALL